jgi:hypothetical protein
VAWDNTYLQDDELTREICGPAVPFIITLRRLLQHSRRLDEAVQSVTETLPRPLGDIVIVGSAGEGRAVALETAGRMHAVRGMEEGAVWSCNCFRSPALAPHDHRGDGRNLPEGEAWQRFPRYTAYAQLFAAKQGRLTPALAAAFLRDPYPREGEGFVHPAPAPRATICRDITSWSLVMEPGKGRLWISDTEIPGCQGRFFAFNLAGSAERLPTLDLAASGYEGALRSAERFLAGDWTGALVALADAMAADGPAAPLLLMQSILHGLDGEAGQAEEALRQVMARWGQTPAGELARAWIEGWDGENLIPIPFPSAIRPLLHLRPAPTWKHRAVPA